MTLPKRGWRGGGAIVGATLCTVVALAQAGPSAIGPLRTPVDGGLWVDSYQALVKLQ